MISKISKKIKSASPIDVKDIDPLDSGRKSINVTALASNKKQIKNSLKTINYRTAYSIVEMSIVIIIVAIILIGITQSTKLNRKIKIMIARSYTNSSPINDTANLVAWFETSMEESFSQDSLDENVNIAYWNDINPQNTIKNQASQLNTDNQPQYYFDKTIDLPAIKFTNQDFFNLPNATIPFSNKPYTIFIVSKVDQNCVCGIIGSGSYGNTNNTNAIRYDTSGLVYNYWWGNDIASSAGSVVVNKFQIIAFDYNLSQRRVFINGSLNNASNSSNRTSTSINNTIGVTNSNEYLVGSIFEVAIFDRSLNEDERKSIEVYLSKKYRISI